MTQLGTLKQDHTLTFYGSTITLPKDTQLQLIRGASGTQGDLWAVRSAKLLIDLTGNKHDPIYRYCFVPTELVDHEPEPEPRAPTGLIATLSASKREKLRELIQQAETVDDLKPILLDLYPPLPRT